MNKENVTAMLDSVGEMLDTASSVRGPEFTKMVKFVGSLQSMVRMLLREIRDGNADEDTLKFLTKSAAFASSILCAEHARALNIKDEDLQDIFKLVDNIEDKVQQAFS